VGRSLGPAGRGKKRIVALARWHFDGGDGGEDYCRLSCEAAEDGRPQGHRCEECPYRQHEPQTDAGEATWEVIGTLGNQLRVAGMGAAYTGSISRAVLALGQALGAPAELLAGRAAGDRISVLVRRARTVTLATPATTNLGLT
jgi:hypothetical protein